MSAKTIGAKVREAREAREYTLRALARAVHCSASHICDIEHGRRNLTPGMAEAIERALLLSDDLARIVECPCCGGRLLKRAGE